MTIDTHSAVSFGTLKYANIVAGNGSKVVLAGQGNVFGQAIIHSRSVGGSLLVSRAKITLNNDTLVRQFSAPEAVKKAIDSYGVDAEKLLEPGSSEQPKPAHMPELATISAKIEPPECAEITIKDLSTKAVYDNEASLPIGTKVEIEVLGKEGWNLVTTPSTDDLMQWEVTGPLVVKVTGTRAS